MGNRKIEWKRLAVIKGGSSFSGERVMIQN
jgi:hypothetical protein